MTKHSRHSHEEPVIEDHHVPAEPEPTIADRARAVLEHVKHQTKHNGPISPAVVDELAAVVNHLTGD